MEGSSGLPIDAVPRCGAKIDMHAWHCSSTPSSLRSTATSRTLAVAFNWAAPGEDAHAFINELEATVGTCLYGRRMHETMMAGSASDFGPAPGLPKRGTAGLSAA